MPGVDERIREALRALAEPADPAGAFERVSARRARRRTIRRLQATALVVAVLAGTGAGTFVLARVFGPSDRPGDRPGTAGTPRVTPPVSPAPTGASGVCETTAVAGDFDGDGASDRATVGRTSCLGPQAPTPTAGSGGYSIDVRYGAGAEGVWPLPACRQTCRAFAAPDLDADGAHELLVVVAQSASTLFLEVYRLPAVEAPPRPIVMAPPGARDYPAGRAVRLEWGGGVAYRAVFSCEASENGDHFVMAYQATRRADGFWDLRETQLVLQHGRFMVGSDIGDSVPPGLLPDAGGSFCETPAWASPP